MLTKEQRAEGLTLLAKTCTDPTDWPPENADMIDWLWDHKDALLAEPPTIDVEAIKREAVREFAEAVIADFTAEREIASRRASKHPMTEGRIESEARAEEWNEAILKLCEFAAARGVNLDEKP